MTTNTEVREELKEILVNQKTSTPDKIEQVRGVVIRVVSSLKTLEARKKKIAAILHPDKYLLDQDSKTILDSLFREYYDTDHVKNTEHSTDSDLNQIFELFKQLPLEAQIAIQIASRWKTVVLEKDYDYASGLLKEMRMLFNVFNELQKLSPDAQLEVKNSFSWRWIVLGGDFDLESSIITQIRSHNSQK